MSPRRKMARFNRRFANHVVGPLVSRLPGFGVVHHRGRTSGRLYHTPVKLFRRGGGYLISLPYGADADWVRNVLAAGGCELTTGRRRVRLCAPRLHVDPTPAELPGPIRRIQQMLDVTEHLLLDPESRAGKRD